MSRCSPSPFDSSPDSASSPPSPPDSGWELRFSQVSPLTSSASSPSRSFSPLCSSPGTPPSPPCSPERPHHVEKPGGKRKYKSRHLNSSKDLTWRPSRGRQHDRERRKRLRREAERRDNSLTTGSRSETLPVGGGGGPETTAVPAWRSSTREPSTPRSRPPTSAAGDATGDATAGAQVTSSPVIITLDSDSSHDDGQKKTNSGSSSPLSSQQTIDFSDLPSLPLAPSAGVGGAVEVGELPADILDRGSDGSESEAAVRSGAVRRGDRGDRSYVDVENTEDAVSLLETSDNHQEADGKKPGRREDPSDRYLLEAILDDLNRIAPLRQNPSQDGGFLSENRERTPQEVIRLEERTGSGPNSHRLSAEHGLCPASTGEDGGSGSPASPPAGQSSRVVPQEHTAASQTQGCWESATRRRRPAKRWATLLRPESDWQNLTGSQPTRHSSHNNHPEPAQRVAV
ncbi:uncharacterized protein LOC129355876 [Poeciliopsis prolifica]|uniref:uncharacterized protein LOC129355876 n=1 Tax=Poeciliopsis prolifica TaxID=188132 RepID=UPI0024144485|nr:uncharacterized protein LOC129355876 [Poeciliopsis prolifica]